MIDSKVTLLQHGLVFMRALLIAAQCALMPASGFAASAKSMSSGGMAPRSLASEPPPGALGPFEVVYVDDRSCPTGQIKKVTGSDRKHGVPQERECVSR